ncbi:AraC family transcriptional regulator [Paenibacillus soyae]|uniref:AraC family transcriptional regulator n=1 Tax=Paenibacillus soyae TaxID=2969249 RepID=A0A9X2MTY8_9BACL|nr:AraC family transcriptional regulator [Paenibacillus soyae]MCR2806430.1 AraC family transcriptional regulator [Paenibacillus soyae]
MKIFGFYKSKKYLQRVMISIMASMVVILVASSVTGAYMLERSVKNMQEDSSLKVLSQIQYNLSYMNEIITRLSSFVFKDPFLITLMYNDDLPEMDRIRGHRQMENIMASSSFLHSMVVYNKSQSAMYGTSVNFLLDEGVTEAKIKSQLLNPDNPKPTNRLIPMSLETADGSIDTFAFIVTDSLKPFSEGTSAIILFIKSDWVFDSLRKMNVSGEENQGEVYIQTEDGSLLTSDPNAAYIAAEDREALKRLVDADKSAANGASGSIISELTPGKSMISYMDDGLGSWTILYVRSYDKLMAGVSEARNSSLLMSGAFLLLAVGLSVWLSYKLYHPIENMLKQIKPYLNDNRQGAGAPRDELGMMSENVRQLSDKLNEISSEQIVQKYYLRKFLTDSQLFSHHDMQHAIEKHQLNISVTDELIVCVLRIDNYSAYDDNASSSSKRLYVFAIVNIAAEIMGKRYPCETVEMKGDHVALILSRRESERNAPFEHVVPLVRDIQQTVERYYGLTLSCGISDIVTHYPFLSGAYSQALRLCQYKIIKGNKAILTSQDVKENLASKQMAVPVPIERKLAEALKKGHLTDAGNELEKAFSLIAGFAYEDMLRAVTNLAWLIKNVADEINENRIVSFSIESNAVQQIAREKETLQEMYLALLALCAKICEGQRPAALERNEMMLETVKELIEEKFADINLSQQSIASTVKLSSAYIGKLFKDSYKMSITEFINEVRLRHAQQLLEQDNYTIAEIMERCGYANQSYFFRLFKGKVGSTPKEYRMKKSIS